MSYIYISITGLLWLDIILFAIMIILIYIIYRIIIFLITRGEKLGKIPPDVINGLKLGTRLIIVILIIILIITYVQLPTEITLAISAIIGTMIGFASIEGIQNFISGIYIIITRPFGINDLIAIGNSEGVVSEISLNYTKVVSPSGERILISNRNVLNSNIINHTIDAETIKNKEKETTLNKISNIIIGEEITRYVFYLELPKNNPKRIKKILKKTANDWESEFEYKPEFILSNLTKFAIFGVVLIAKKPITILRKKPLLIKDLYQRIFSNK